MNVRQTGFDGPGAGDALKRARALLERGDFQQAQRLYRGVLSLDPANVEALHLLGLACYHTGDAQQAEPLIARSLQLGLREGWALANHGMVLVRLGRHEAALAVLDESMLLDGAHAPAFAARGNALLALGEHAHAQAAYERALELAPGHAEAWSNRGNALRAQRRPADALISFDRALLLAPHDYATYTNRGHALRDLGRYEEALRSYKLALVIRPKMPELLSMCGAVLLDMGQEDRALACYDEALTLKPDDTALLYQSCVALDRLHRYEALAERCKRLLKIDPGHAGARFGLGNALQGLQRHEDALHAYSSALELDASLNDALRNRGAALRKLERYAQALDNFERAIATAGPTAELLCNRGGLLQQMGRYDDALASYEAALDAPAATAQDRFMRALALQQLGRFDEALDDFLQAQTIDPHHGDARRSAAFGRMLTGDFAAGWARHECRGDAKEASAHRRFANRPLWLGAESVAGKTVFLHAEQGYGDTLQFCRYSPLVEARGAKVILEVPAPLKTLLGSLGGVTRLIATDETPPPFDLQCPLMSLPLALGIGAPSIPAAVPYLRADRERRPVWQQRIDVAAAQRSGHDPARKLLTIGLAWSGNPHHNNDPGRSIPLAALSPVFTQPNALFVSLQPQVRERDALAFAQSGMLDFGALLTDYTETAALVDVLDLVISVDTSVVHLAGALGKPVWVLLPRVPDWRWLLGRDDSPWYPDARLFRQPRPGDWPAVIDAVARAFEAIAFLP